MFRDGDAKSPIDYDGPREATGIVSTLKKQSGPAVKTLADADAVKEFRTLSAEREVVGEHAPSHGGKPQKSKIRSLRIPESSDSQNWRGRFPIRLACPLYSRSRQSHNRQAPKPRIFCSVSVGLLTLKGEPVVPSQFNGAAERAPVFRIFLNFISSTLLLPFYCHGQATIHKVE